MTAFVLRRFVYSIFLLFIASLVIFYGLRVAPGDVTEALTTAVNRIYLVPELKKKLGLDKPLLDQYLHFMGNLFTGDPGISLVNGNPVGKVVREAGLYSLKLAGAAIVLTYAIAIPLGILAAWRRNSALDQGTMLLAVLGMGIPNFFLAILLIHFFAIKLKWLPVAGSERFEHLVLPAIVLAAEAVAINLRLIRSSVLEELGRDYVRSLRARGLTEWRVVWLHAFRNALPPVIALAAVMLRGLLAYTMIIEVIFRWPGVGFQLVDSILKRDYTLAQVLALLLTFCVILFNFLADVGQQYADPRVRERARAG